MILAAMNLYSLLQYIVLAKSRKARQLAILRPDRGAAMQDSGYELRRIILPRTPVNKSSADVPEPAGWLRHIVSTRWRERELPTCKEGGGSPVSTEEKNKALVREFFEKAWGKG